MTRPRARLPNAGPVRARMLGAVAAAAALAGAALLATAPGMAGQAAALPGTRPVAGTSRTVLLSRQYVIARPRFAVVIMLDTNAEDATAASRIAAERRAALRYLAALPASISVGLITFSEQWHLVVPPVGHERLVAALAAVRPGGLSSTGLAGGLSAATAALGKAGAGAGSRLLVLSDGEDLTGHLPTPSSPVDVVMWRPDTDDNGGALRSLARASGGHTAPPNHAAMLAGSLAGALAVPAASGSPAPSGSRPAAGSGSRPAAGSGPRPAAGSGPRPAVGSGPRPAVGSGRHRPLALIGALASVFTALMVMGLLVTGLLRRGRRSRLLAQRIAGHAPSQQPVGPEQGGTLARAAVSWVARLLKSGRTEKRLAERLDLAGITHKPAEWILLGGIAGLLLATVLVMVTGSFPVGVLAGALLSWLGMRLAVRIRIARRRSAFAEQLPDLLQLVAGSLRSGFSLTQALDATVREGAKPASTEFARALSQTRIGVDVPSALQRVADRMDSTDLQWTVMTIRIQRQVGGHLSEVLSTTVGTMRERAQLRRHVKALSAEGRLSAYVLIALPVLIGGWLFMTSPAYMRPLYTTPIGMAMLAAGVVLVGLGALWMRKVIKVVA